MSIEIKAIQCPKCGSTQKTQLSPGDFRCDSCGTEYILDDGTPRLNNVRQMAAQQPAPVPARRRFVVAFLIIFVLMLVGGILLVTFSDDGSTDNSGSTGSVDYRWDVSYSGQYLYRASDGRAIFLTLGTKVYDGKPGTSKDYISFNDVGAGTEIARLQMPGNDQMTRTLGYTDFDVREFSDGNIYIIGDNAAISRVSKTAYAVTDVTKTLFKDQPELISGIAKAEFADKDLGEGFNLITNDGKNYFYFPLTRALYTKERLSQERSAPHSAPPAGVEKTGIDFSKPFNSDYPDVSAQLIAFRYRALKKPHLENWGTGNWNDSDHLQDEGVLSYADFTPGRVYFEQGLLYQDSDYVLITYTLNPAKNAKRFVQCLNTRTGGIVFTTEMDELYPPDDCIRYKDGFATAEGNNACAITLSGKLVKFIPVMYRTDQ